MQDDSNPTIEPVDGSEFLLEGFWPLIRYFLFMFLPIWVFLIGFSAGLNLLISSVIAGLSISFVVIYEKFMLKRTNAEVLE